MDIFEGKNKRYCRRLTKFGRNIVLRIKPRAACANNNSEKENTIRGSFAGIHVSLRGIAGFTDQRTAFTRAQSAILQGPDFNLRVKRARKIPYSRS